MLTNLNLFGDIFPENAYWCRRFAVLRVSYENCRSEGGRSSRRWKGPIIMLSVRMAVFFLLSFTVESIRSGPSASDILVAGRS